MKDVNGELVKGEWYLNNGDECFINNITFETKEDFDLLLNTIDKFKKIIINGCFINGDIQKLIGKSNIYASFSTLNFKEF